VRKIPILLFILPVAALLLSGCESPLNSAARSGNTEKIRQLLDNGTDVNGKDFVHRTALADAAYSGNTNCVKLLLDRGANVNGRSAYGETALYFAAGRNQPDCVKLLLDHGADADCGDLVCNKGYTPLMSAADGGYFQCAKLLLDYGANIDIKAENGKTALDLAGENGHSDVVKLIETALRERTVKQAQDEKQQIASQLQNASLAQLLGKNDFNNEAFVAALTDKLIDAKNQELPAFIAKSTVEQRTAMLSTVEKRLAQAQATVLELNGRAEDAIRKGEDAAGFRRQVGKLQAYIAVLTDIKNILNQS